MPSYGSPTAFGLRHSRSRAVASWLREGRQTTATPPGGEHLRLPVSSTPLHRPDHSSHAWPDVALQRLALHRTLPHSAIVPPVNTHRVELTDDRCRPLRSSLSTGEPVELPTYRLHGLLAWPWRRWVPHGRA